MSTKIPQQLKYTAEHEWIMLDSNGIAVVGITDFAQNSLGDVVYVELPATGKKLTKDQPFGVVESIKSVSDLYAPITGEVIEKNTSVETTPELINTDCYANWLLKIKPADIAELNLLLSASQYQQQVEGK